jgi:hypothetical protein
VSQRRPGGGVVVDTGVFAADVVRHSPLVEAYAPMLVGRHVSIVSTRRSQVPRSSGPGPNSSRGALDSGRSAPSSVALADKAHDADCWVAATALHLGLPVVAHDVVFRNVPGLVLETALTS